MGLRNLISGLAVGAAALGMVALGGSTAGAATPRVNVSFVAVGITSPSISGTINYADWNLTGVAIGTSPLVGTMSIEYSYYEPEFDSMAFTLSGIGGSITGGAGNLTSTNALGTNTLNGIVTSATGSYAGLVGHIFPVTIDLSPKPIYSLEQKLGTTGQLLDGTLNSFVSPSALLGSFTIS
ncbi:MAG TPA: hypothetical protein VG298_08920 [Acidimicrobiales bacterium]|jgi:hypothetical protein|nr:hypothetical protein [Acidimicrobiales bacterium]